jgi:hypothetical protein
MGTACMSLTRAGIGHVHPSSADMLVAWGQVTPPVQTNQFLGTLTVLHLTTHPPCSPGQYDAMSPASFAAIASALLTVCTPANALQRGVAQLVPREEFPDANAPRRLLAKPAKRNLKFSFFYEDDAERSASDLDYLKNKLMPATTAVLSRSIRVRAPSAARLCSLLPCKSL